MTGSHTAERAREMLYEWTEGESLRKHGLAVAACVEAYGVIESERLGLEGEAAAELVGRYRSAGLLHDMDYERHPSLEEHPFVGVRALREQGWPEEILHAILAHADYSGTPRESHLDKALFACDELAGFLTACALVKPTKSIMDVEVRGREEEDEGQGVCARGEARGHHRRGRAAGHQRGGACGDLSAGDAGEGGGVRAGRSSRGGLAGL